MRTAAPTVTNRPHASALDQASRQERQQRLTGTVPYSQGNIASTLVGQDVDSADSADAPREVALYVAQLSEHELDATIVTVV